MAIEHNTYIEIPITVIAEFEPPDPSVGFRGGRYIESVEIGGHDLSEWIVPGTDKSLDDIIRPLIDEDCVLDDIEDEQRGWAEDEEISRRVA